ncbi:MAG: cupin domain-containing protein [Actinomycetota bacterium]
MTDPDKLLGEPTEGIQDLHPDADTPGDDGPGEVYQGAHLVARPLPMPAPSLLLTLPGVADLAEADDAPASPEAAELRGRLTALADANAAARAASLERLATWFPGYDFDVASQTTDDRRFSLLQIGGELFEYLNALEIVEQLLVSRDFPGNKIIFSHGARKGAQPERLFDPTRPALRRPQIGPLVDALDGQWTCILNSIDQSDERIASVIEHLERAYGCPINTNVYISWGEALGFGPHWDSHDTIIVPAAGTKRWRVFEPTVLAPQRPWIGSEVSDRPVWEGDIEPGMCLVIPRGWGHEVLGSDDLSVHYTIGVNRLTVTDALQRIVTEGGLQPLLRGDLAYHPRRDVVAYDRSIHDDDVLTAALDDVVGPQLLERAMATHRARMTMRSFPRLFDTWISAGTGDWSGATVRMPVPSGVHVASISTVGAVLAFGNQQVEADAGALAVISTLADTLEHPVSALEATHGASTPAVLRDLVRAGLAEVRLP